MKIPKRLQPLVDDGMIDEVLVQLMSGKEAQVYVVRCGEEVRCAKVFKEAKQRSLNRPFSIKRGVKSAIAAARGQWPKKPVTVRKSRSRRG